MGNFSAPQLQKHEKYRRGVLRLMEGRRKNRRKAWNFRRCVMKLKEGRRKNMRKAQNKNTCSASPWEIYSGGFFYCEKWLGEAENRPNVIKLGIPDARQELSIVSSDPWPES